MAISKKDKLTVAAAKAASATNLFSVARSQLQQANDLLDESVAADQAAIAELQARVADATAQKSTNTAIAAKLEAFVA